MGEGRKWTDAELADHDVNFESPCTCVGGTFDVGQVCQGCRHNATRNELKRLRGCDRVATVLVEAVKMAGAGKNYDEVFAHVCESLGVPKRVFAGAGPESLLVPNKDDPRRTVRPQHFEGPGSAYPGDGSGVRKGDEP